MLPKCGQMGDLLLFCTEFRSSLTDWNYFVRRLKDWFLLPKLSDALQFVDDSEVVRITEATCKCGWGFMNSRFVAETTSLNHRKFSRRVEINSSTFFCLTFYLSNLTAETAKGGKIRLAGFLWRLLFPFPTSTCAEAAPWGQREARFRPLFHRVCIWKVFCERPGNEVTVQIF